MTAIRAADWAAVVSVLCTMLAPIPTGWQRQLVAEHTTSSLLSGASIKYKVSSIFVIVSTERYMIYVQYLKYAASCGWAPHYCHHAGHTPLAAASKSKVKPTIRQKTDFLFYLLLPPPERVAAVKKNPKLISFGLSLKKLDLQYLKQMYVRGLSMHRLTFFTVLLGNRVGWKHQCCPGGCW